MSIPLKKLPLALWHEQFTSPHLPMTKAEMDARGWDAVDIVFVTGDAYIDHPSFAMAILGRTLESAGFRVAILSQPDWRSVDPWRQFGKPRLFFGVSAGNMDSMINHYTANKKVRNDDAYSPGGRIGLRPDRATMPYSQRCREAYPGVPVIAGGVEASLRRLAHYDYWSDTVKRAIMLDAKCDMVAYGMGEKTIVELAKRLQAGETIQQLRGMRGMAFALGAREKLEDLPALDEPTPEDGASKAGRPAPERPSPVTNRDVLMLPSYEEVKTDKNHFAEATRLIHLNNSPFNARTLVQYHDREAVVVNPPAFPLTEAQMDALYDLPYTRRPHPIYKEPIPAQEMIKDSVTIMRGCFGGCTFCSITAHQGRVVQSRSKESVLKELNKMASDPDFKGTVSDIGGPTANMYQMRCTRPEVEAKCKRLSCVHPSICKLLGTDHGPLVELMKESRTIPGIKKVLVASGVRMDLAQLSKSYMKELAGHHVGGLLKVAPEHVDPDVLAVQKKPDIGNFDKFAESFKNASAKGGKPKQYLVPYFISAHPGSDLKAMINLALYLKQNGYKPDQVQDFIPAPFDIATCMYYTGIDPFTKQPVNVAKDMKSRKMQRALMQFFKPENYFEVRAALIEAGRSDLIGGCDGLIPAQPPKVALDERRRRANEQASGEYYHKVKNPSEKRGYRPGRSSQVRQVKPGRGKGTSI
ncbi:MAG: YgiQ family radical SAM protein [Planctomycetia bacterium]|nr:YgiQ family radical SAM protein [Planctomycetia bacterium]